MLLIAKVNGFVLLMNVQNALEIDSIILLYVDGTWRRINEFKQIL